MHPALINHRSTSAPRSGRLARMSSDIYRRLGQQLRQRRGELGWSLRETEARSGMGSTAIRKIEIADGRANLETIEKLCTALHLEMHINLHPEGAVGDGALELLALAREAGHRLTPQQIDAVTVVLKGMLKNE